jgi:hypothetical protein
MVPDPPKPPPRDPNRCNAARQAAADLGKKFANLSHDLTLDAGAGGLITFLLGLGEAPSLGADSPATLAAGAATGFVTAGAFVTGAVSAGFNSYAKGTSEPGLKTALSNLSSLANGAALNALASRFPILEGIKETISAALDLGTDALTEEEQACVP